MRAVALAGLILVLSAQAQSPSAESVEQLEGWYRRYDRQASDIQELLVGTSFASSGPAPDLARFQEAYLAHQSLPPERAHESFPADLIAAIRQSSSIKASRHADRFANYANLLELLELTAQAGSPTAVRLLLRTASHDYERVYTQREWHEVQPFRPHLVRREARLALLRIPGTRALESLLATLSTSTADTARAVPVESQAVAATLLTRIVRREELVEYRQFQLLETAFLVLAHGVNEPLRSACGEILEALLQSHPDRTISEGKLHRLLDLATGPEPVGVAVAALRVLRQVPGETVLRRLAERLADSQRLPERVQDELLDTLDQIAPVSLEDRDNRRAWLDWYSKERDTERFQQWVALQAKQRKIDWERKLEKRYEALPRFYGVPTVGRRIVFVIDVSGSMSEPLETFGAVSKISMARRELVATLRALPERTRFNLVKFNPIVRVWSEEFQKATSANKETAANFIHGLEASGGTNLFGGVTKALGVAKLGERMIASSRSVPDQIIILTDGRPTLGLTINTLDILEEVGRLNAGQTFRIDTIAFGLDADQDFLRQLAEQNGGKLIAVLSDD